MSAEFITRSNCDRCDILEEHPGAESDLPPIGWATISFDRRLEGSGWTNNEQLLSGILCPGCQALLLAAYEGAS